ncbi:AlpA family phage regulatory protein [Thioalkalicoccus limnaeus]|uniref:AlpA family phage regulatory protein n=1 Tax=Thioalkalicoccus limnaeus TaxID=120681 RepID=A0ABV4BEP3_9GAMM
MATLATPRRYLRERALANHLSVHRSTLRRWVARGLMPAPIRLGLCTVVWDVEEIEQWQAARAAAARDQPG